MEIEQRPRTQGYASVQRLKSFVLPWWLEIVHSNGISTLIIVQIIDFIGYYIEEGKGTIQ